MAKNFWECISPERRGEIFRDLRQWQYDHHGEILPEPEEKYLPVTVCADDYLEQEEIEIGKEMSRKPRPGPGRSY